MVKNSYGLLAKAGQEIGHELFDVVRWRISPGIKVFRGETRIMDLGRVKGQLEPLMPFLRIFDLKAPLVIVAVIGDLSKQCEENSPTLRTVDVVFTHVGTFALDIPSRPSEVASGHRSIRV